MARLEAKVSRSEVLFILKNTFSAGICWWNRPHTSFLALIAYMVRSGAKLFRTKTLLNFASKSPLKFVFPKNTFSVWILVLNRTSPIFLAKRTRWHDLGQKCPAVNLSILKNTFSVWIFWWNRPHTSFLGLIGYMVRSGAKLFRTKTLLNFASNAISNSFFQKTRFRFKFLY